MKNKFILILNIIFILAVFTLNYFYQKSGFDFTLKCICSFLFAVLGIINLIYAKKIDSKNKAFYSAMTRGLVLAFLGDVFIVYNFIAGAFVFALGHVLFVIAYCFLHKLTKLDFVLSAVIFIASSSFLMFYSPFDFGSGVIKAVCVIYALIISLMFGKSLGNFIQLKNAVTFTIALASFLFFFSDLMLVLGRFARFGEWANSACMGTYYPAVCLLAFSIFLKINTSIYVIYDK